MAMAVIEVWRSSSTFRTGGRSKSEWRYSLHVRSQCLESGVGSCSVGQGPSLQEEVHIQKPVMEKLYYP